MANVNTTTTNRNIFTTIGRNTAAIVAAGTLALGLSGCDSGNGRNDDVKPLPTPSQIDKPTTDPTTPATQEPSQQETNNSSNACVGRDFGSNFLDALHSVDSCLRDSGYKDVKATTTVDADGDGAEDDRLIRADGDKYALLDSDGRRILVEYDK